MEQGRNHTDSKYFNRALILRLILNQGPTSRLTLARLTGLSPAALTVLTGGLLEEGLLVEVADERDNEVGRVGRRSVPLDLNTEAGVALGIHITPRLVRLGLVNLKGEIVAETRQGAPDEKPAVAIQQIVAASKNLINRESRPVLGVGVGAVGLVEHKKGVNLRALSLHWQNVPIKAELEAALDLPVEVDNNVRGMALGELLFGYGRTHNFRNIAVVYIGTGVGGGVVIDGELYWGSGAAAGEIGHMIIDQNGPECYCGAQGCVEQFAGEAAILNAARRVFSDPAQATMEYLMEAATQGDEAALKLIRGAGRAIGIAVANVLRVLNPDTVIIAGRIARSTEFMQAVQTEARRSNIAPTSRLTVLTSSLGDNVGMVGAAALALREFLFTSKPYPMRVSGF